MKDTGGPRAKLELVPQEPDLWAQLRAAAEEAAREEPRLASQLNAVVLAHDDLAGALSFQIARKLGDAELGAMSLREVALSAFAADPGILTSAEADLKAVFPQDTWNRRHLQIIYFGREYCPARHYDLTTCPICSWAATQKHIAQEARR